MSLRFINGAFKLKGVQTVKYEVDVPQPKPAVAEVPTVAPEPEPPIVAEVPTVAPEEPVVAEVPTVVPEEPVVAPSEVEASLEIAETALETGLIPENPPTE